MQTDKRMRAVGGEDPRSVAARDAEIDRLLHAHFAGDLERRAAAGCAGEELGEIGQGLIQLCFGTLYGFAAGIAATLTAQWAWSKLTAWWAGAL